MSIDVIQFQAYTQEQRYFGRFPIQVTVLFSHADT